ncbi:hypothetical protein [Corallococcus silvisoli]|uniref:hypothetical protein n=1 Tax=Corallococcus silvisoli TaxID=2697031 RepID=UPI0013773B4E|nr:hypothetical protein [Corallococcus silvisoli]NBD08905.1 hypothetical protein [Corallococcus silvisoli]
MHTESPRASRISKAATLLRAPVLLAVGMMTMGSGMGNPGCGSGSSGEPAPSVCESGCAIEGSYTLQFADTSPPGGGCEALGLKLPTGPLVLTYADTRVGTTLGGADLSGFYYGEPGLELHLSGTQELTATTWSSTSIQATVLAPAPQTATAPSTLQGTYELQTATTEASSPGCFIRRNFTATR